MANPISLPRRRVLARIALVFLCSLSASCRINALFPGEPEPSGGQAPGPTAGPTADPVTVPGPKISDLRFEALYDSARIEWATDIACACRVDYGPSPAYGMSLAAAGSSTAHSVELGSLEPDRVYYFRVTASGPDESDAWSDSLRTASVSGGLHAASVTVLGGGTFRYVYDWSDEDQLLDWIPTTGAGLSLVSDRAAVAGGSTEVRGMSWRKTLSASRVAVNARTAGDHINLYTNLDSSWNGAPWNPNPAIAAIYHGSEVIWAVNESTPRTGVPAIAANTNYDIELTVSPTDLSWSRDAGATTYRQAGSYAPVGTGRIALGAYGSGSSWGSLTIEGRPEEAGLPETPEISGVTAVTDSVTTVSWSTDLLSTSLVEYGTDPKAMTGAVRSEDLSRVHALTIEGLQPGTQYWYRVSSRAASGSTTSRPYSYLPGGDAHPDEIVFKATGASFAAIIEVDAGATVLWTFADGTTSSLLRPSVTYGSEATRLNRLKVTPWSAIRLIDIGYDGGDGGTLSTDRTTGYGLDPQNVIAVYGLRNAASSLLVWASSHNPIRSMDFHDFTALETLEAFYCQQNREIDLRNTPALRRLCLEDNDLVALDLSGCPALEDLRGAQNSYTSIEWGTTGAHVWHICVRDNPQLTRAHPAFSQFPALTEIFIWNNSQGGVLEMTPAGNPVIGDVEAFNNRYTSANLRGIFPAGRIGRIRVAYNDLVSLDISENPGLVELDAGFNNLDQAAVDGILETIDGFNTSGGTLNLDGNAGPSTTGLAHAEALSLRGWTVTVDD